MPTESCKDAELRVPSPPPRRLSRSSIDLRDLEYHNEKLTLTESSTSIFPLKLENYLRYSGSEPLHNENHSKQCSARELNIKTSAPKANFFQPLWEKAHLIRQHYGSDKKSKESIGASKDNQNKLSYNNLNNNQSMGVTSSGNKTNTKHTSTDSFINNLRNGKRKHMAASESDFLRMRNTTFSAGGNSSSGSSGNNDYQKLNRNNHSNVSKHRSKQAKHNLIYALSDSDFLSWNFRSNEYSKMTNLNQAGGKKLIGESNEAIFDRADLVKVILGKCQGPSDYLNLAKSRTPSFDAKLDKSDNSSGLKDCYDKKYNYIDDDTEIKIDDLIKESITHNIDSIIDAALVSSCTDFGTILSPVTIKNDEDKILNTSKSSEAVLMNNERLLELGDDNCEMFLISPPSTPCTPKINNQDQVLLYNIGQGSDIKSLTPTKSTLVASDASTVSLDLVASPNYLLRPKCTSKYPTTGTHSNIVKETPNSDIFKMEDNNELNQSCPDKVTGLQITDVIQTNVKAINREEHNVDENCSEQVGSLASKKRQSSTVTYNVNVINFGEDDESISKGPMRGSHGARSNSSTSK